MIRVGITYEGRPIFGIKVGFICNVKGVCFRMLTHVIVLLSISLGPTNLKRVIVTTIATAC